MSPRLVENAASVVRMSGGRLRGSFEDGCWVFRGIPYAASPFGSRRFAAPEPAPSWEGVREAVRNGPSAPQPRRESTLVPEPVIPGDDCLNLNVFTPDLGDARLPTLVWVHGGGFFAGSNASPWYVGTRFARDGVVLVSVNYRLGVDGFMAIADAPDNRGVLDWIAALAWVQENIHAFGGDPANITVGGQSAGGGACTTLLALPAAGGYFRRVIAMSGGLGLFVERSLRDRVSREIAERLGVPRTRAGLGSVPLAAVVEAQAPPAAADPVAMAALLGNGGPPLQPAPDGSLLPAPVRGLIEDGAGSDVDVLVGATESEFEMAFTRAHADDASVAAAGHVLGLSTAGVAAYRALHRERSPGSVIGRMVADKGFRVAAHELAQARAAASGRTYVYEFRWQARSPSWPGLGAGHCLDIPFAFDLLAAEGVEAVTGPEPPPALATAMHRAWVDFCRTGDPGWPAYTLERRETMIFDELSGVEHDPCRRERELWRSGRA